MIAYLLSACSHCLWIHPSCLQKPNYQERFDQNYLVQNQMARPPVSKLFTAAAWLR